MRPNMERGKPSGAPLPRPSFRLAAAPDPAGPRPDLLATAAKSADSAKRAASAAAFAAKTLGSSGCWSQVAAAGGTVKEFAGTASFDGAADFDQRKAGDRAPGGKPARGRFGALD